MRDVLRKVVFLVTGNVHKFNEARSVLREFGLSCAMLNMDAGEIQDDNLENIAKVSAMDAGEKSALPIIVEDAGLFIDALNGFPGPYSSYVFRTIGIKGVLQLMRNVEERSATFHAVVAFYSPNAKSLRCFHGKVRGKIARQPRGIYGFGFDPIFLPRTSPSKTFAEISLSQKNMYSHRAEALRRFAKWYCKHLERKKLEL
ncbi:MAG: XTP/dITP diphosphatase [Candidatus Bathyarchaeia archaeon]